jgi:transcriptional regulator with XRE-family HTH domain
MKIVSIKENMDLKLARTKAKISQLELSLKTQISQTDLSLFERGLKFPSEEQAGKIAEALCVDIKEIFPELLLRWQKGNRK